MEIKFFINATQEDEGAEIIHFPAVIICTQIENEEKKYWSELAFFIQSLNTTSEVLRVLQIIHFYKSEPLFTMIEINLWNDVRAIIKEFNISFKRDDKYSYKDELSLDDLLQILSKWMDYLQSFNKENVIFNI